MTVSVAPDRLKTFCRDVFLRVGTDSHDAEILADTLIAANLRGVDTHGVMRLSLYASRIEKKILNTDRRAITVLSESATTCLMEGAHAPGQILGVMAMDRAIELARSAGIGIVGVRNSNNFGAAAYYAMKALDHNMIGIVMAETGPILAPYGSLVATLGNNPLAAAIPAGDFPPVVLDIAMSVAAGGKVRKAAQEGDSIPEGWVMTGEGYCTTDPHDYLDPDTKSVLLPFAGHKGSGLAIIIGLLAGVMTGPTFGMAVGGAFSMEFPQGAGHLYIALNVEHMCETAEFKGRVDARIRELKTCPRAPGFDDILVPGELEHRTQTERLQKGIPIGAALLKEMRELGTRLGVDFPATT